MESRAGSKEASEAGGSKEVSDNEEPDAIGMLLLKAMKDQDQLEETPTGQTIVYQDDTKDAENHGLATGAHHTINKKDRPAAANARETDSVVPITQIK